MELDSKKIPVQIIQILSHKFKPKEHVVVSFVGIKINLQTEQATKNVAIDIPKEDIVAVDCYLAENRCALFVTVSKNCAAYIQASLKMIESTAYQSSNQCKDSNQIMFQITSRFHLALSAIYSIFDPARIKELDKGDYLVALDKFNNSDPQLLVYPPPHKAPRGITINREDYKCLSVDNSINDVIIDFYLKYLYEEKLTDEQRDRTFIFSQFFYTRLAQSKHADVKGWTKNVNLFEKDFIVAPINVGNHWILAIVCFSHFSSTNATEKCENSVILIFDSVPNDDDETWNDRNITPMAVKLRDYLTCELNAKYGESREFNDENMPDYIVDVPQQGEDNLYDSGVYLLQYAENFFQCPIKDYRDIDILNKQLANWFDENVVNKKREDLSALITKLVQEYYPDKLPLPTIKLQKSEQDNIIYVDDEDEESDGDINSEGEQDVKKEDEEEEADEDDEVEIIDETTDAEKEEAMELNQHEECPIKDYRYIVILNKQVGSWFDESAVNAKREDLSALITKLVRKYNPKNLADERR